jgi:hypothetical protein
MPTLGWIGKKAGVKLQCGVPDGLIHCDKDRSAGAFKQIAYQIERL